jgi:argininosuccinate synthase
MTPPTPAQATLVASDWRPERLHDGRVHDMVARLAIAFEGGVPVSINGVQLQPVELLESVATIAAGHGVGDLVATAGNGCAAADATRTICEAPAALVLRAAHQALYTAFSDPHDQPNGVVRVRIAQGAYAVESVERI